MTSRGRGGSISDWDPMREDFNDSHNHYDDASEAVSLDYTKLYVANLPAALGPEGLAELFSKYGKVLNSYFSRDPVKRYAFVSFETAGEARIAMMKLNKTEPFGLHINFAHGKPSQSSGFKNTLNQSNTDRSHSNTDRHRKQQNDKSTDRHSTMEKQNHSEQRIRGDSASVSSRGRKNDERVNGIDEMEEAEESNVCDQRLEYDLEKLKLQRLQIMDQQLQVQQRMLIQQQRMKSIAATGPVTKRRLLPDGRSIQVTQDNETSFSAGAGDSRNIPRLQREGSRNCVVCGAASELFCSGCRVTPYCTERCQRRDWDARHQGLCHNLARLSTSDEDKTAPDGEPDIPAAAQLRRPHSPSKALPRNQPRNESGSDKSDKKPSPPAQKLKSFQQGQQRKSNQAPVQNGYPNQAQESGQNRNQGNQDAGGQDQNRAQNKNQVSTNRRFTPTERLPLRQPMKTDPEPKPAEPTPPVIKPTEAVTPNATASANVPRVCSVQDGTPRKPLVPSSYIVEKLAVGATFMAAVVDKATNCGSKQAGFACLMLHEDYGEVYNQLCDAFSADCQKDNEPYTPRIGETFAYLFEDEEGWYRARCLTPTRAALLDSGRVVSFSPRLCRKLPAVYGTMPEFVAVLMTQDLEIGANLSCTVVGSSSRGIKVNVADASSKSLGDMEVTRWSPDVEYPTERLRPPLRHEQAPNQHVKSTVETKPSPKRVIENKPSPKPVIENKPSPKPVIENKPVIETKPVPKAEVKQLKSVQDSTPRKPLVPTSYMVERLPTGATFLAEAINLASNCGSKQAGFACLMLHEDYGEVYNQLCDAFSADCQKDNEPYTPSIGETFAFYCEEDEGWYRARCLAPTRAALLDAGRVVSVAPRSCRRLPASYVTIPEFVAVLKTQDLQIGDNLSCTVVGSSSSGIKVSVADASGKSLGDMEVARWTPVIDYPEPTEVIAAPVAKPAAAVVLPEVPRPAIEHNALYVLLDVTSLRRACVRPCDPHSVAKFDAALQDTVLYGIKATPLKEPPQKGQTVVAKFIDDGTHYRAFVKRVSVAKNKYLIEYIEYGNEEIVPLERLYPCPAKLQLDAMPAQASIIKLSDREPPALTRAATQYVEGLKDAAVELILTIPGGVKCVPSGSLANLLVAKTCEAASKKIEELCTPGWVKLAEKGGDVLETESRFYSHLKYSTVPTDRPFTLQVTFCDVRTLAGGTISGYEKGDKAADIIYGELTDQITQYCASSLCRDPYLPKLEELCITRNKRVNKWVRSVLVELGSGAGSRVASVVNIDYGDLTDVPVADVRKMLPEFVDGYPALALHFEITGFPHNAVKVQQLERGMKLMGVTAEGAGELRVASCRKLDELYEMDAPELIAALTQ